jgi:2-phospho-L-lactate transferase/gluconeogenesis factor (CofD/UPF0052 family)
VAVAQPTIHGRRISLPGASVEQALHRCVDLASPFGSVIVFRASQPSVREFVLELAGNLRRYRWTLSEHETGTELLVTRQARLGLPHVLDRRGTASGSELGHRLDILPHLLNMRIVVIGGGTGLYTTLKGLRDRTSSLTALIAGLTSTGPYRQDELGALPRDEASLCLLALAASGREVSVLRGLLEHRLERAQFYGARFGTLLLEALCEIHQSTQAALDEASVLLGVAGRVMVARDGASTGDGDGQLSPSAAKAIGDADLVVIAPGHFEEEVRPVLGVPGVIEALSRSHALTVAVTKVMTGEHDGSLATTSQEVTQLTGLAPGLIDVVLANEPAFTTRQLEAYAATGARPIRLDLEQTARLVPRVRQERLTSQGDLARHDAALLGEHVIEIGAEALTAPA